MSIAVYINFETSYKPTFNIISYAKKIARLKHLSHALFEFTFINDMHMKLLHKLYLNTSISTDILSFNLETIEKPHGDIYICIDQAEHNAIIAQSNQESEIKLLMVHGILHCLGYNDTTKKRKRYYV